MSGVRNCITREMRLVAMGCSYIAIPAHHAFEQKIESKQRLLKP
jgi:hypothetical protein